MALLCGGNDILDLMFSRCGRLGRYNYVVVTSSLTCV